MALTQKLKGLSASVFLKAEIQQNDPQDAQTCFEKETFDFYIYHFKIAHYLKL